MPTKPLDTTDKNVIHWIAQAYKRIAYPVDFSDLQGFSAFEYTWKSFNALYSSFHGSPDSVKMEKCIKNYLVEDDIFFNQACIFAQDIARSITNYKGSDEKKVVALTSILLSSLDDSDYSLLSVNIVKFAYHFRNKRVHGKIRTTIVGDASRQPLHILLSKSIALLCIYLVSGKTGLSVESVEEYISQEKKYLLEESIQLILTWRDDVTEQLLNVLANKKEGADQRTLNIDEDILLKYRGETNKQGRDDIF